MTLRFDAATHRYYLGDQELVSVTTALRLAGVTGDVSHITEEQRTAGVYRHTVTELDDQGDLDEETLDPALRPALDAWRAFRRESGFTPTMIEQVVYSVSLGVAGRIDRVGTMGDGSLALVDIKGPAVLPSYGPQLWLYWHCLRELTGQAPAHRLAVHLEPGGTYRVRHHAERADLAVGLAAVTIANWKRARGRAGETD